MLTLAIIGRPNVGKSTLFNRLTGTPFALVDDTPGVTRDVREGKGNVGDIEFILLDTAGLEQAEEGTLSDRMTQASLRAVQEADAVLMMVDARAGITPMDRHFAGLVRKSGRPAILLVNKAEGKAGAEAMGEAYGLGLGEPVPISAAHGEGMGDLYEALSALPQPEAEEEAEEIAGKPLNIAILGRPNVGKSTLINRLLGEERVLTGPEAGITRDAISVPFEWKGKKLLLVDTAGIRRRANVQEKLEKMSVGDSLRAIQYAEVAVLTLDATTALEKQDNHLAALVEKEGRAMVIALNKWDLVENKNVYLEAFRERMDEVLTQVKGIPVIPVSGTRGQGLDKLMQAIFETHKIWNTRIGTGELNRFLEAALSAHAPPLIDGRRLKIRYITQPKTRPPTFMLSCNLSEIPDHYSRYLVNSMRERFGLRGVPIRLKIKKSKNPYEGKEGK